MYTKSASNGLTKVQIWFFQWTAEYTIISQMKHFPVSVFWLKTPTGQIKRKRIGHPLIDFLKPEVQDLLAKRIIAVARCGLYDSVLLDGFNNHGTGFVRRYRYLATDEEIIGAILNIFRAVRSQVREDFLILINANESKPTRYAEFINGTLTGKDHPADILIVIFKS